jgi:lipoprotein signal peptidase
MLVEVYLASQNPQNVVSTTVTLHHYDRPQWAFFNIAIVLLCVGAVSVFKSKR